MCLKTQIKNTRPQTMASKKNWLVTSPVLQQSFQVRFAPTPPPTSFFVWPGRVSKRQNREIGNHRNPRRWSKYVRISKSFGFQFPWRNSKSIKRIQDKLARGIRLDTSSDHVYEKVWRRTQQITRKYTTYKLVLKIFSISLKIFLLLSLYSF